MTSNKRKSVGSYRRAKSLVSLYAKSGKDRRKANRNRNKHKKQIERNEVK